MSRDELLKINGAIVSEVAHNVANCSPDGIIIVVTNPVDAMTYLALRVSGFLPNRVLGLSGVLDGARFSSFIAAELGMPASEISALVLGGHGQNMVVLPRLSTVGGRPLTEMLPQETIARLVERTINGGAEVVGLLRVSSASYAPSAAIARMIEAIILDKKEILPCAVYLEGEYGIKDTVVGVPVKLGKNGIEEIIELKLIDEEKKALKSSAEVTRQLIDTMKLG
jgi:malate dehydrogenase